MSIECMGFKSYESGSLLGFANFYVPKMGLEIYGCTLVMKDGKRWLNLPAKEYKDKEGNTKYQPILRFRDKDHKDKFSHLAKEAIDEWCAKQAQAAPTQEDASNDGIPF